MQPALHAKRSADRRSYELPGGLVLPSVSTILEETPNARKAAALHYWRQGLIRKHGEAEGIRLADDKRDRGAQRGAALHDSIRRTLQGKPTFGGVWHKSIEPLLPNVTRVHPIGDIGRGDERMTPVPVWNEIVGYAGTPDLLAEVDLEGLLVHVRRSKGCDSLELAAHLEILARERRSVTAVIDWKTWDTEPSDPGKPRRKYRIEYAEDHMLQACAYAHAVPFSHAIDVDIALVVVALPDQPALVLPVDLELAWQEFQRRKSQYDDKMSSMLPDDVPPPTDGDAPREAASP